MRGHNRALKVMNIRTRFPLVKYPHFWRKLLIGRQVMFESKGTDRKL